MKHKLLVISFLGFLAFSTVAVFAEDISEGRLPQFSGYEPSMVSLALDASPFTGETTTNVPIQILPAAGDMQERIRLALEYRSGGGNSWLGKGWDLELGSVSRINKFGANNSNNPYLLALNGQSQELVSVGGSQYRTKLESYKRIEFDGSTWSVWEKDGTRYDFGASAGGRWVLTRVTDTHGLSIVIDYDRPNNEEMYLKEIRYPEGQGLSPYCRVSFIGEDRQDKIISYYGGALYKINRRLKEIQILAEGTTQKRYVLNYSTNQINQTSLLDSVIEYGKDGQALPPTKFTYVIPKKDDYFGQPQTWQPNTGNLYTQHVGYNFQDLSDGKMPQSFDIAVLDITGDGIPDFIGCKYENSYRRDSMNDPPYAFSTTWILYRGTKTGFSNQAEIWLNKEDSYSMNALGYRDSINLGCNATLADMNADGLPDLVYSKYANTINFYGLVRCIYDIKVRFNTGNTFGPEQTWLPDGEAYYIYGFGFINNLYRFLVGKTVHFADMNGDGKADLIYYRYGGSVDWSGATHALYGWNVRLNTGNGFSKNEITWLTYDKAYFKYGWDNPPGTIGEQQTQILEHIRLGNNAMLVDMNQDGLPDLVYNDFGDKWQYDTLPCSDYPYYKPNYNWKVRYNTGNGFGEEAVVYFKAPVFKYKYYDAHCDGNWRDAYKAISVRIGENGTIVDVNNDGLPDLVFNSLRDGPKVELNYYPTVEWKVAYNLGDHFDTSYKPLFGSLDHEYQGILVTGYANVTTTNSIFTDIDMDGKNDFIYPYLVENKGAGVFITATFDWKIIKNLNFLAGDVLSEQTNYFGGKKVISYVPSGEYNNPKLNFSIPVTRSITQNPGVGDAGTTTYNYEGGWYDIPNREFRGFRHVQATDPLGYITHTYYHQDDPKLGKIEKEEGPIKRLYYTYASDGDAPYFTPLTQADEYLDAKCKRTTYEYDSYGNITKAIQWGDTDVSGDEKSILTDYAINSSSWLVSFPSRERIFGNADASGSPVAENQNFYDNNTNYSDAPGKGDLTKVRRYLNTKSDYIQNTSAYDAYGNETSKTDANGNTTAIEYDSGYHAFPVTITNAKNHIERNTYYSSSESYGLFGQLKLKTDPNANATTFEYDGLGRKTKITGPYDTNSTYGSESYAYAVNGAGANYIITRTTEESGTADNFTKIDILDGFERIIQSAKESENQNIYSYITTSYNPRGEIAKTSLPYFKDGGLPSSYQTPDGSLKWTQYSYDAIGRITAVSKPDGYSVNNSYSGWAVSVRDENNHPKTISKDAYGRLISVREENQGAAYTTNYSYDALDNLTLITDHAGNRFEFFYDTLGRRTKMIDPDLGTWLYEYDNNGNLTRSTDANGTIINFAYDALSRIINKDYAGQTGIEATYNYDETASTNGIGRRTSMQDLSGSSRWNYDKEGRVTKLEKVIGSDTHTVEWGYDAMDRVKSITYPNLKKVDFSYNNAGLTEGISGYVLNTEYNASSQLLNITFSNPVTASFDYYPENQRLKSIISGSLQNLSYEYDGVGNITRIMDTVHSDMKNYVYDDLDRLLLGDNNTYEYNAIGNITKANGTGQTYSLTHPHALINDGINDYTYDNCGNMLTGAGRTITYDPENRPSTIAKSGTTTYFIYDGDGKRVRKVVSKGTSSTTNIYVEDLYEKEAVN